MSATPFPLSAAQRGRRFLYRLDPAARGRHNTVFAARVHGVLDAAALGAALDALCARHAQLRARFRAEGDADSLQDTAAPAHWPLHEIDAHAWSETALAEYVAAQAYAPFDDAHAPLRAVLLRRGEAEAVLLLALDHLVCDGWSYWRLLDELDRLLRGERLAPLAADYREYVLQQRQWLTQDARAARQFAYWEAQLATPAEALRLPCERAPTRQAAAAQERVRLRLPPELGAAVAALAQRQAASPFAVLLTAFTILLHRYGGQDDILVGAPLPGRTDARFDGVVGDFVNPLPLRTRLAADERASEVLRRVRGVASRALANQDYALADLAERLPSARGGADAPLFDTVFLYQNARQSGRLAPLWGAEAGTRVAWGGVTLAPFDLAQAVAGDRVALALQLLDLGSALQAEFAYDATRFERATVERLAAAYRRILEALVAEPDQRVGDIDLLGAAERRRLTQDLNATAAEWPRERALHEWVAQQAARTPQAPALVCGALTLTYAELDRRADAVARRLVAAGVQRDDRVAIFGRRDADLVAGLLGVLKAGGAYVPLDPAYPPERVAYMLADCAPRALLCGAGLAERLPPQHGVPVLALDAADAAEADLPERVDSARLAYVIYTSGSTGQPKGVAIEHRQAGNFVAWALANFSAEELAHTLFATSINFDLHVFELYVPLAAGGCVHLVDDVLAATAHTPVSLVNTVPSGIQALLDAGRVPAGVRLVNLAGEPLPRRLVERLFAETGVQAVANLYGPSETTTYSTWVRMPRAEGFAPHIGVPVANTQVYVLDAQRRLLPQGAVGELYIGGAGVARGYLHRPELTAERFLPDPFAGTADARMYKTGDLGRWRADGALDYLGRNDFQVKIRGHRVELGEIEARLAACAGVREAVVVARTEATGETRLVAYVTAQAQAVLDPAALRAALARDLAGYMLPSAIVELAALPRTPNGKLDRAALPMPTAAAAASAGTPPSTPTETLLAALYAELLQRDGAAREDDFFALGGHSLLAMRLVGAVARRCGRELPLRQVFDTPRLADLAAAIDALPLAAALIPHAARTRPLPPSSAQERLWFIAQLDPAAAAAYHLPAALQLDGALDAAALRAALDRVLQRHEVLRTRFVAVEGELVPQVQAEARFALREVDLAALDANARETALAQQLAEEAAAPFDLAAGPAIRGRLIRLTATRHVLLVTQHHIVSDGWSLGVLVRELRALYAAFAAGAADPLPPLPLQYADYAAWQRAQSFAPQLAYWREQLRGAPALLELPGDRPRPTQQDYAGASVVRRLPASLRSALLALGQAEGTTLFMTLVAGWGLLLARLSGSEEVVIGSPIAGRRHADLGALIGLFVNTLALRVRVPEQASVRALLQQVRATTLDAYAHEDLPFEQVVEAVQPLRSLGHSPLFQAMLALDNAPDAAELALPGLALTPLKPVQTTTQFDLSLSVRDEGDGLRLQLDYATALFDAATVQRWLGHFEVLLGAMAADAERPLHALPLQTAAERHVLLEEFNATRVDYGPLRPVHEDIAAQARRRPEAIAVQDGETALSYAELDARANAVARRLLELGVRPDDRVGLCCARSAALIVGLVGILKAGAAYVPLDPAYPAERLADVLEDSAPIALLVDAAAPLQTAVPQIDLAGLGSAEDPGIAVALSQLAYVIYTSGSTGRPKGVMIEHGSLANFVRQHRARVALGEDEGVLQFSSCAFDASIEEIWPTLAAGARLVLRPTWMVAPDADFLQLLERERVAMAGVATAFWHAWAQEVAAGRSLPPACVRKALVGGEKLETRHVRAWHSHAAARGIGILNTYGPTECTCYATVAHIDAPFEDEVSIGRPVPNARAYVLDAHGEPVPLGVTGEIFLGGAVVGRGYLHRDALTAERFLPDPFVDTPGARMYKTGDLGRWRADGTLDYLGRNDDQVKLRGFRIELGEIEARLAAVPEVQDAVVVLREDAGEARLVAYLVAAQAPDLALLRDTLARQLPDYMLPQAYVTLSALPRTPNGKTDRRALPAPDAHSLARRGYEAPQGEVEERLAAIWQELLGVPRVGRHDHFFELGGHSLAFTKLSFSLQRELDVEVKVAQLYEVQVLKDMAAGVEAQRRRRAEAAKKETTLLLDL